MHYKFRTDKNLSLGAGLVLDAGLREYGLSEKLMEYSSTKNGKPVFKEHAHIYFNLSHSGHLAVASFNDYPVGVDIQQEEERANNRINNLKVAAQFFSKAEYEYISSFPSQELQNDAFYRIWALKESFIKNVGLGMEIPFSSFWIMISKMNQVSINQQIISDNIYFKEYRIDDYHLAICSLENSFSEIQFISF